MRLKYRLYISIAFLCILSFRISAGNQTFRHVEKITPAEEFSIEVQEADSLAPRSTEEIIESLPAFAFSGEKPTLYFGPKIFHGFRKMDYLNNEDSISFSPDSFRIESITESLTPVYTDPYWLQEAEVRFKTNRELQQLVMTSNHDVDYIYSNLPTPPKLLPALPTFSVDVSDRILPAEAFRPVEKELDINERHWLHNLNLGLQFSQAYISPNWYQGGNNNLTVLANFLWDVSINPVYHPGVLLESHLQYKLGLFSTPDDSYHKYTISEDQFQWNAKAGFKAFRKWFYSMTIQFKTPMFRNYEQNGPNRTAAFLSPADLNIGLGMTYTTTNKSKTLNFGASIAPISYNLKTCMDTQVDGTQFNIPAGKKSVSEIGSTAELTLEWKLTSNITYKSRLFLFSNYKYFNGDWENTISFAINRFLSTQIYVHGRYDTSSEITSRKWKHWMLKEILSFGFSYAFSTTPKK